MASSPSSSAASTTCTRSRRSSRADRYVHVGDTEVDERYALLAGFEFLHVDMFELPVVADSIHDAGWAPSA